MTNEEKSEALRKTALPNPLHNGFDYRGLIEKGLAIEVTEGMYNIE